MILEVATINIKPGTNAEFEANLQAANLDQLPPFGFKVACFPAKIKGGSAGWTRAVAIFE